MNGQSLQLLPLDSEATQSFFSLMQLLKQLQKRDKQFQVIARAKQQKNSSIFFYFKFIDLFQKAEGGGQSEFVSWQYKYLSNVFPLQHIFLHTMFVIKVTFKAKNILLGKGIDSFERIRQEIQTRFPGDAPYGIVIKYQGNVLQDFQEVVRIVEASSVKSIKLEVEPAEEKLEKKEEVEAQVEKANSFISSSSQQKVQKKLLQKSSRQGSVGLKDSFDLEDNSHDSFKKSQKQLAAAFSEEKESKKSSASQKKSCEGLKESLKNSGVRKASIKRQSSASVSNGSCIKSAKKHSKSCLGCSACPRQNSIKKSSRISNSSKGSVYSGAKSLKKSTRRQNSDSYKSKRSSKKSSFIQKKKIEVEKSLSESQKAPKRDRSVSRQRTPEKSDVTVQLQRAASVKKEQSSQIFLDDIYTCFYCEGVGLCKVCKNTGRLTQNSKFMKLIDKIVENKIEQNLRLIQESIEKSLIQKAKLLNVEKKKEINDMSLEIIDVSEIKPSKILESSFSSKILEKKEQQLDATKVPFHMDTHYTNPKVLQIGDEFTWSFIVKNGLNKSTQQEINIIDQNNRATMAIEFKENSEVKVGPYKCEYEGKFQKLFRLGYFDENSEMQFFGPRFGFSVKVEKNQKARQLINAFRQKVESVKKGYKVEKDTEYLIEKLKEMGINEDNYLENQDLLPDILQTL